MSEKLKALINGVFRGLDAPRDVFVVNSYEYRHSSELEAMRSDWRRVGHDIKDAMKRADVKATP